MLKLGVTSLLESLPRVLALMVPIVKRHYNGIYRNCANYEHVWTGFILMAVIGRLMAITPWMAVLIVPSVWMHVVWKEIIYDAPKRTTEAEKKVFWVNLIERISGFIFGSIFLL